MAAYIPEQGDIIMMNFSPQASHEQGGRRPHAAAACLVLYGDENARLNVPENFPVDELSYSLSVDSITVAAEDSVLRNHSSLVLGYIDFKQMNLLTSSQMDFAVQLPEGFTDMDDIEVVTVSFEADDLASTNLSLKNFQLVNVPEGFTVTVEESALRVYVLGKKSIISGIAAGDFVVKVDLSDMRTRAGKYEMPVSIYAPTKGYVWAVGEYSVTVDAKAS